MRSFVQLILWAAWAIGSAQAGPLKIELGIDYSSRVIEPSPEKPGTLQNGGIFRKGETLTGEDLGPNAHGYALDEEAGSYLVDERITGAMSTNPYIAVSPTDFWRATVVVPIVRFERERYEIFQPTSDYKSHLIQRAIRAKQLEVKAAKKLKGEDLPDLSPEEVAEVINSINFNPSGTETVESDTSLGSIFINNRFSINPRDSDWRLHLRQGVGLPTGPGDATQPFVADYWTFNLGLTPIFDLTDGSNIYVDFGYTIQTDRKGSTLIHTGASPVLLQEDQDAFTDNGDLIAVGLGLNNKLTKNLSIGNSLRYRKKWDDSVEGTLFGEADYAATSKNTGYELIDLQAEIGLSDSSDQFGIGVGLRVPIWAENASKDAAIYSSASLRW